MNKPLAALLLLVLTLGNIVSGEDAATGAITSETDLAKVIARLDDPKTARDAQRSLIKFSGLFLYEGSVQGVTDDRNMDTLRRSAAKTLRSRRNVETVRQALEDEDRDVRFWGVMGFVTTYGQTAPWEPLVPRLMKLAVDDSDAGVRCEAIRRLRGYQRWDFLHALQKSTNELDPWVLMMLFEFDSQRPEARARFYARAIECLSHKDARVRLKWLAYINQNVGNPVTAPMWRIEADQGLINKLQEIRKMGSVPEKDTAGNALDCLLKTSKTGKPAPDR